LISKTDNFEAWVSDLAPDIIGVTESWANCDIRDSELALEGYDLFRKDRPVDRTGGGVLLYVNSRLLAAEVAPFSSFPEQVWCYFLDANNVKCNIGVCYRSPTVDIYGNHNHDLVRDIVDKLHSSQKHFLLMGDFNYRFTTWPPLHSDHNITVDSSELANCLDDNFFTQHVDFPTRNDAILDLVISDEPHMVSELTDLDLFPGSDHKALSWKLDVKSVHESNVRNSFDYRKADITSFRRELQAVNWEGLFSGLTAELSWLLFKDYLEQIQHKFIPLVNRSRKCDKPIWMTHKALKAVKHRRLIYNKYKDSRHPAYVKAAKYASLLIRQSRQNFEELLAKQIKDDRKSFFAYVRSNSKCNIRVGDLSNSQGQLVSDATDKAELLNDFFSSVFTRESVDSIPLPAPCFTGTANERLCDINVDSSGIADRLQSLRSDKAAGDDNLSRRLLKVLSTEIAIPVSLIFRKSLDTGCVPRDWRTAIVSPLFKKGRRTDPENYRLVSLTSQIVKVVESVLRDEIVNHLEKYSLIRQSQHGFRKGYSCTSNLLSFLESVTASLDAKRYVDTIYLDFAKAFDTVLYQRLLKLRAHGIDGVVCDWIGAWLKDGRRLDWRGAVLVASGFQRSSSGFSSWSSSVFGIH